MGSPVNYLNDDCGCYQFTTVSYYKKIITKIFLAETMFDMIQFCHFYRAPRII